MVTLSNPPLGTDQPAFRKFNEFGSAPLLLLCDHASNAVPPDLADLGLGPDDLGRHIAFDIGVAKVTETLSSLLDAPALLHNFSRLLIDPNRTLDDPTSICAITDGTVVPGNKGLTASQHAERSERFFHPYHRAIDAALSGYEQKGIVPAVIGIHSYNPIYKGVMRPWHVGFLWGQANPLASGLIEYFSNEPGYHVGDNQPYDSRNGHGYTIETHVDPRGLPNALVELRNDLITTDQGAIQWARQLAEAIGAVLSIPLVSDSDQVA